MSIPIIAANVAAVTTSKDTTTPAAIAPSFDPPPFISLFPPRMKVGLAEGGNGDNVGSTDRTFTVIITDCCGSTAALVGIGV